MPILNSTYKAPLLFTNGDVQTIYAHIFRKSRRVAYKRERITTPDGDFLDLDWKKANLVNQSKKLIIISHGMEGSSYSKYIVCILPKLVSEGYDCLAWNFRSCSGEPNLKLRFYHSGVSDDLDCVINHAISINIYDEIILMGFSMGGNITLKYLGEKGGTLPSVISKSIVYAVPCDLRSAVMSLAKPRNFIYMQRFLKLLRAKIKYRSIKYPEQVSFQGFDEIKNFINFDKRYTAPIHGFKSEEDYWEKCSSKKFINDIRVPTLLVNSKDDPFLADGCYPYKEANSNKYFFLETPKHGGHMAFIDFKSKRTHWSERRAIEFIAKSQVA